MTTLQLVELGVLGPLQARQDGAQVTIPGAKPRAVLTMLGLHAGSVVAADTLVELLWGDDPPRTAAKALQTHISLLRRTLGDGFVLTEGAGWTLAQSEVDAVRYKSAARLGRDAAAAGDTGLAVTRFEEALALWRGIPELIDSRRGTSEKTRWIEGHAALAEDRADALLATGRAAEIIGELEAAVSDAPLRERRWGQLMLALYRAGRQGEALGAYQRARALLADELGVDPGPDLRRLEAKIVAQDTTLETPVAQHVPAATRAVTFLLTDIEGSTAAWEADADAMGVALARHDELVEQVVTSRGGRLVKTRGEGDATFSVFERPSAAAAAAIELQEAIVDEPWALREPMRIRVALHTGEVEFRDGDYFGRAVNRAARLRSLAEGGQILCSGATGELVIDSLRDDVVLADLGMRQLKNLARPEHVFELRRDTAEERREAVSTDAPVERPSLPGVLGGPGPFVGRGRELGRLFSAWQSVLAGGTNAVLIAGEPGVGKTRLAGEWSRQVYDQGALVIYGRCDEDLGAPYQPFAEALRSLVPCLGTSRLRGLRGVEALLPMVPGLTDVLPDVATPTRADPDTERYALFDAVVAVLGIASASAPVVLILDDLHWAAKPTLLLLRHILRFGEHDRVQIVGTYRSTDLDRSHPLAAMLVDLNRGAGSSTADRLALSGLDEDDVTTYVAEAGYDDEELARALASVTGGNPFFLIEALRHVDESDGHWDPSTLPQGVREAVSRRLTRLPAETNKALAAAAVVGSRFGLELVEHVVGEDLVDAFDEACKAGIVIEEPGGRYRFNHAIVRQSLLAELPSVRRLRLHQRIATTLENQPGADDELLAELAYHYFECAWAGNAAKAVEYCRRAADHAMARLSYEGAADLYDRALHALEEIDDELPDRDDQVAAVLIARCEALLAAGDVTSAAGAVAQLQEATRDSARLAAWATCFDGQLSMLIHPERLDEVETAVGAAAQKLAELDDAAGEAMAHTVRAGCLHRLGRIGDCEIALDDALTAARRAREHRRVNAVLAGAPLAALWGPNPVPRAGGRCLDVVRLLRITTDSPAVEATSTRCQAVLEAFRGRAAAARRMIDSARRTVTELGLRHALVEVEQFAGIVELVVGNPPAAEPHLRKAYNGFRRMGLDADTAETAALLGRTCLALDRDAEADELCTESERLAGHGLKASIAWRTLRARLLSRANNHDEARRVAEAAVSRAERTDALVDHGDACLTLATVLRAAGNAAGARAAAERAADLYERKGAAALAERARHGLGNAVPTAPAAPEPPAAEFENACVRATKRTIAALNRQELEEIGQLYSPDAFIESRRKIVGFTRIDADEWVRVYRRNIKVGALRFRLVVVAVRGERLALSSVRVGSPDQSPGSPYDEFLALTGIDEHGRFVLQLWFDAEDLDDAIAELDAAHARQIAEAPTEEPSTEPVNACVRVLRRAETAANRKAWDEYAALYAADGFVESRRKITGFTQSDLASGDWARLSRGSGGARGRAVVVAVRGERLALIRLKLSTQDESPGAPVDEMLALFGIDEDGRIALQVFFDIENMDAALAELDAATARFEVAHARVPLENLAVRTVNRVNELFAERRWDEFDALMADNLEVNDPRRGFRREGGDRATELANVRAIADIGVKTMTSHALAIRGERLVLVRTIFSGRDQRPDAFRSELLFVSEINTDGTIAAMISFELDEFDSAIAELEARYLAGEAAAHARTWSVLVDNYAALNRHELPAMAPDCVSVDHRRGTAFPPGEVIAYARAALDHDHTIRNHVEAVHLLNDQGVVFTHVGHENSPDGFDAEWRIVFMCTVQDGMVNRCELFDEADLDAALAQFERLGRPTSHLENAASRVYGRVGAYFAARDWDATSKVMAPSMIDDDRRRMVNAGIRRGRDAEIANSRATAELGAEKITSTVIATRGDRLALCRTCIFGQGQQSEAFRIEFLSVVEIQDSEQLAAHVAFELDDFEATVAELDGRYIVGEAASYPRTWSAIAQSYAAINRHEQPAVTPDWITIDHRREPAMGPGDLNAYLESSPGQNNVSYVEVVHRLSDLGAVITYAAHETSQEGFDAEWRGLAVLTVSGNLINRCEVFDEANLDAAVARFDELNRPALGNAASQAYERVYACLAARDWDAMAEMVADDVFEEDRRRMVNAGILQGREAGIAGARATADVGFTLTMVGVMATRGERLALLRVRAAGADPGAIQNDALNIVEVDAGERIVAVVVFDLDNFDAAIAELDARYLAGEAADHARTWSVIADGYAGLNRHELPSATSDLVSIDHRRGTAFAPGEVIAYARAGLELDQSTRTYAEAVHRITDLGVVCTHIGQQTSPEGFEAEWRIVLLFTVQGDLVSRFEVFDEADLDAALAKFEQLSQPAIRLGNAASQVAQRFWSSFVARKWDAMAELLADDVSTEDRRRVASAGSWHGRDFDIASMRAAADIGATNATLTVIATRGGRLALTLVRLTGRDQGPDAFHTELRSVVELDTDNRIVSHIGFDVDDFDAAFEELDARYLAGEAAPYAHTWSAIAGFHAGFNRHELPAMTPRSVFIDHRPLLTMEAVDLAASVRAAWDVTPDMSVCVEAVHRLSELGVVVTHALKGASPQGFKAEWRTIEIYTVEGDRLSRCETFGETDLDVALARFDVLHHQTTRLENTASRAEQRFFAFWGARNWAAIAEILAEITFVDDTHRNVANVGFWDGRDAVIANLRALVDAAAAENTILTVIATRGERLVLSRRQSPSRDPQNGEFVSEGLIIAELDADDRIKAHVQFDLDDIDPAFAELDARYLAGEAAAHAHTWSVITGAHAAFNRREFPITPIQLLDHRPLVTVEAADPTASIRGMWNFTPDLRIYVETVHRMSDLGVVFTQVSHGTSQEGFAAEWRLIELVTVGGDLINQGELFDEDDLDAALARFEELHSQARRLENTAVRANQRFFETFTIRDWAAIAQIFANDIFYDDRRRVVNGGSWRGRDLVIENMRAISDFRAENLGFIAIRGERLALGRWRWSNSDRAPETFHTEVLCLIEVDAEELIARLFVFDPEDFDAAFEELDARYLAGEAAAHSHTWSVIAEGCAAYNRHELPLTTSDSVNIDNRRLVETDAIDLAAYIRAGWANTPDVGICIQAVHRLSDLGAVVTEVLEGASQAGFDAEWRMIGVFAVEGDAISRVEMFDEIDLHAALARFDELQTQARRVENAASQVDQRFWACIATRDWDAIADRVADDIYIDDRRKTVNAGIRHGRDDYIADLRTIAEFSQNTTSTVVATRGTRLALTHIGTSNRKLGFAAELLCVVEIDADDRMVARIGFDIDDIEAAFEELDARYITGEAGAHASTWSLIAHECAAFNGHELPAADWVTVDHRRLAVIDASEGQAAMHAIWDVTPDLRFHIEAVHRLNSLGTVAAYMAYGTSPEGFDAEWPMILLLAVERGQINRCEVFDETDLDAALARFDELQPQHPRLENAATQVAECLRANFTARDWIARVELLADDCSIDDRRKTVNAGNQHGRDADIANMRAMAALGVTNIALTTIATRGERLALSRARMSGRDRRPEAFYTETVTILEIDAENRAAAQIVFDPDDIDAAFAELETRYLAGEAAANSHTWSVVAGAYATLNRREIPATTPDCMNIDHRRGIASEADVVPYLNATWTLAPDIKMYIEAVHRLTNLGALVTWASYGTSEEGFDAEWRGINILMLDGDLISHGEIFDEADLDAACARFEELRPELPRLENAASQVVQRFLTYFAARDWDAIGALIADDILVDDRRRVVNAGSRHGRDAEMANLRAIADVGVTSMTQTVIAVRGARLVLGRHFGADRWSGHDELGVYEVNAENQIVARVDFGSDDIDAAFEELDARYLAGEAAAQAQTWSVITRECAAFNRHELSAEDWVIIDHRRLAPIEASDLPAAVRAIWDVTPDLSMRIESVHRLSSFRAVVTITAHGTSTEGFDAEWRMVELLTVEDDRMNRCEFFDEADLDAALARFEELDPQGPRLENAASQVAERFWSHYATRDWVAVAELFTDDVSLHDRRRVVNAGVLQGRDIQIANLRASAEVAAMNTTITVVAIRGQRLVLTGVGASNRDLQHGEFGVELLDIVEITDTRIVASVVFDPEDVDAALDELDARYLAGEAAPYAETWRVIAEAYAALNRGSYPETMRDCVHVDHRLRATIEGNDLNAYLRAAWDLTPDFTVYAEAVHHLSDLGAVVTHASRGSSPEGFDAEWRMIAVITVAGGLINRSEFFDEAALDAALVRFDELDRPAS